MISLVGAQENSASESPVIGLCCNVVIDSEIDNPRNIQSDVKTFWIPVRASVSYNYIRNGTFGATKHTCEGRSKKITIPLSGATFTNDGYYVTSSNSLKHDEGLIFSDEDSCVENAKRNPLLSPQDTTPQGEPTTGSGDATNLEDPRPCCKIPTSDDEEFLYIRNGGIFRLLFAGAKETIVTCDGNSEYPSTWENLIKKYEKKSEVYSDDGKNLSSYTVNSDDTVPASECVVEESGESGRRWYKPWTWLFAKGPKDTPGGLDDSDFNNPKGEDGVLASYSSKYFALLEMGDVISVYSSETGKEIERGKLSPRAFSNEKDKIDDPYVPGWDFVPENNGIPPSEITKITLKNGGYMYSFIYNNNYVSILFRNINFGGDLGINNPHGTWSEEEWKIIERMLKNSVIPDKEATPFAMKLINRPNIFDDIPTNSDDKANEDVFANKALMDLLEGNIARDKQQAKFSIPDANKGPLWVLISNKGDENLASYVASVGKRVTEGIKDTIAKVTQRADVEVVSVNNNGELLLKSNVEVAGVFEGEGKTLLGTAFVLTPEQVSDLDRNGELSLLTYKEGKNLNLDLTKACKKDNGKVTISRSGVVSYSGKEKPDSYFLAIYNPKDKKYHYVSQSKNEKVKVKSVKEDNSFALYNKGEKCSRSSLEIASSSSSGGGGSGSGGSDTSPTIPFLEPPSETQTTDGKEDGVNTITYTYGDNVIPAVVETPKEDVPVAIIFNSNSREFEVVYRDNVQGTSKELYDGTVTALFTGKWTVGLNDERNGNALFLEDIYYHIPNIKRLTSQRVESVIIGLNLMNGKTFMQTVKFSLGITELASKYEIALNNVEVANLVTGVQINFEESDSIFVALYGQEASPSDEEEVIYASEDDGFSITYTSPSGGGSKADEPMEGFA